MVGFDQRNPHHCFDLLSHSFHTVESIQPRAASLAACERNLLLCAAFFHDIGKIECATDRGDRLVFYVKSLLRLLSQFSTKWDTCRQK